MGSWGEGREKERKGEQDRERTNQSCDCEPLIGCAFGGDQPTWAFKASLKAFPFLHKSRRSHHGGLHRRMQWKGDCVALANEKANLAQMQGRPAVPLAGCKGQASDSPVVFDCFLLFHVWKDAVSQSVEWRSGRLNTTPRESAPSAGWPWILWGVSSTKNLQKSQRKISSRCKT
jgi:hypothetical protein